MCFSAIYFKYLLLSFTRTVLLLQYNTGLFTLYFHASSDINSYLTLLSFLKLSCIQFDLAPSLYKHPYIFQCEKTLRGHKGPVLSVSVHPSGKLALSVGKDKTMYTWNLINGRKAYVTSLKTG